MVGGEGGGVGKDVVWGSGGVGELIVWGGMWC